MVKDFIENLNKAKDLFESMFGESEGNHFFKNFFLKAIEFRFRMRTIIVDVEHFTELYAFHLFPKSEEFYIEKYETSESSEYVSEQINGIKLLFYVGLFHKIENYENDLLEFYNSLATNKIKSLKTLGIDFEKKKLFADRDRIRLICNSVKHNNSFPKKELSKYYPEINIKRKLSLANLNFEEDAKLAITYVQYINLITVNSLVLDKSIEQFTNENLKIAVTNLLEFMTKDKSYKKRKLKNSYLK